MYYDYEFMNSYNGRRSPTGTVENDYMTSYFMRSLYQRAVSVFDWDLPAGWNANYFRNVLFANGFIGVIDSHKFGVIPQICTLTGYGLYMQPTNLMVKQPLVSFDGRIGEDCELIQLTPDYMGIWDIIEHYAVQLSTIQTSVSASLKNSRLSFLLGAKNKAAAETLKAVLEKISSGEPAVIVDKKLIEDINGDSPLWVETFNVKDSYIIDLLLNDMRTILEAFDKEIGIPSVESKKERMISDEVAMQTADSCARLTTWMHMLDESIARTNALFNLNISYEVKGGAFDESLGETDIARNV